MLILSRCKRLVLEVKNHVGITGMNRLIRVLLASLLLLPFPVSFDKDGHWLFGAPAAHAKGDGDGDDGDGDGDDGGDDDNSGRGNSDDDDRSGRQSRGGDEKADRARKNKPHATMDRGSRQTGNRPQNLHLKYPNGWDERIRNGRYTLIDPHRRKVADRAATFEDYRRMRTVAGN